MLAGETRRACLIHDGSLQGQSPEKWAGRVKWLAEFYRADLIIAEVNQGGNMVKSVLRQALGAEMPIKTVRASKSKSERAAPVALAYEQGRVAHLDRFPALEDEMCQIGALTGSTKSPDRADALVWAMSELLIRPQIWPRIRLVW